MSINTGTSVLWLASVVCNFLLHTTFGSWPGQMRAALNIIRYGLPSLPCIRMGGHKKRLRATAESGTWLTVRGTDFW